MWTPSLALGASWGVLMLFSQLMITKEGFLLIKFLVTSSLIRPIVIILLICLSLALVTLGVMGGEVCR